MKRSILAVCAACLIGSSLVGCSDAAKDSPVPKTTGTPPAGIKPAGVQGGAKPPAAKAD